METTSFPSVSLFLLCFCTISMSPQLGTGHMASFSEAYIMLELRMVGISVRKHENL